MINQLATNVMQQLGADALLMLILVLGIYTLAEVVIRCGRGLSHG